MTQQKSTRPSGPNVLLLGFPCIREPLVNIFFHLRCELGLLHTMLNYASGMMKNGVQVTAHDAVGLLASCQANAFILDIKAFPTDSTDGKD